MPDQTRDEFKQLFNLEFTKLVASKNLNSAYISSAEYLEYIDDVKEAKSKETGRTKLQCRRIKRFDVFLISGVEKLIVPVKEGETSLIYYVSNEDMFDVLYETHISIGHGGKHRMLSELKKKYKNTTEEAILLFLKHCLPCQKKQKSLRKGLVVKPIISSEMNSRGQVDLIDMQTNPDGQNKFILQYQDHLTKFVQLRPLHSKTAVEVAKVLLDIFCIFGAPSILQSDNGREFVNKVIEELKIMWPGLNIVHGKPRHSQSQGSVERANQDVQNMLMTWTATTNCTKWSEGLRFVQFMKNRAYHSGIKRSPYTAMFGTDAKLGLSSSIPEQIAKILVSEEDLENINSLPAQEKDLTDDLPRSATDQPQLEDSSTSEVFQKIGENAYEQLGTEESSAAQALNQPQNEFLPTPSLDQLDDSDSEKICQLCGVLTEEKSGQCTVCARTQSIKRHRTDAKEGLENQAKKMKSRSNLKFSSCEVGTTVRVSIPEVDRSRCDFRNILMVVTAVDNEGLYTLANENGLIEEKFSRNQFTPCEAKFLNLEKISREKVSLRQLANKQSTSGGQGFFKCNCKSGCAKNICKCKAAGILCNSKCHHSLSCCNK